MQQYLYNSPQKVCKKCKTKPVYWEHSTKYCLRCYETRKEATQRYAESHREEMKQRTKAWQLAHPEKTKEYYEKAKTKPERVKIRKISSAEYKKSPNGKLSRKRYYEAHKDEIKEATKKYVKANIEKVQIRRKTWLAKNPEKHKGYTEKYRRLHPEQVTKSSKKRREAFKNVVGTFTKTEWDKICNKFGNKCLWCGQSEKLTVDHVVPISRGGRGDAQNLQPLCLKCNSKKGKKILDFRPFGSGIAEWT